MRQKRREIVHAIMERAREAGEKGLSPSGWIQDVFGLSRQQSSRYLAELCAKKWLRKVGVGAGVRYTFVEARRSILVDERDLSLSQGMSFEWKKADKQAFDGLSTDVQLFTRKVAEELLSNSYRHSHGGRFRIELFEMNETLVVSGWDDGLGIFNVIMDRFLCHSLTEAAGELIKGARMASLAPGLGLAPIFSIADYVTIEANGWRLELVGRSYDWSFRPSLELRPGTTITIEFVPDSPRLKSLSREVSPHSQTKVHLPLAMFCPKGPRSLLDSRDARRILRGVDDHRHIILDFNHVESVYYSFLTYIFVEFKTSKPSCGLMPLNMSRSIRQMLLLIQAEEKPRQPLKRKRP